MASWLALQYELQGDPTHPPKVSLVCMGGPDAGKTWSPGGQAWQDAPTDGLVPMSSIHSEPNLWCAAFLMATPPSGPYGFVLHDDAGNRIDGFMPSVQATTTNVHFARVGFFQL